MFNDNDLTVNRFYFSASATVVPCLTTMISSYGSAEQKGTVMGIFRSLGALARAVGPMLASTREYNPVHSVHKHNSFRSHLAVCRLLYLNWFWLRFFKATERIWWPSPRSLNPHFKRNFIKCCHQKLRGDRASVGDMIFILHLWQKSGCFGTAVLPHSDTGVTIWRHASTNVLCDVTSEQMFFVTSRLKECSLSCSVLDERRPDVLYRGRCGAGAATVSPRLHQHTATTATTRQDTLMYLSSLLQHQRQQQQQQHTKGITLEYSLI